MTDVIEVSRESYIFMLLLIGILIGLILCPFFMWLGKQIKKALEE